MNLSFSARALCDLQEYITAGEAKLLQKMLKLLGQLEASPRDGLGKPEQLKNYSLEIWSRQISDKHRLVYHIDTDANQVVILSCCYHYDDK